MRSIDYTLLETKSQNTTLKTLRIVALWALAALAITTIVVLIFGEKALSATPLWIFAVPLLRRFGLKNIQQNTDSIRNRLTAFAKANDWKFLEIGFDRLNDLVQENDIEGFRPDKGDHFVVEGTVNATLFRIIWLTGSPAHMNWPTYRTIIQTENATLVVSKMALYPDELRQLFVQAKLDQPSLL